MDSTQLNTLESTHQFTVQMNEFNSNRWYDEITLEDGRKVSLSTFLLELMVEYMEEYDYEYFPKANHHVCETLYSRFPKSIRDRYVTFRPCSIQKRIDSLKKRYVCIISFSIL